MARNRRLKSQTPRGTKKLKVSPPQLIIIGNWIEDENDLTLQAIQQRLESQENTKVSISTVWRILHHLNLTRKKNTPCQ